MIFYDDRDLSQDNGVVVYNDHCLNVLKNMRDESVDLIISDPPYGIAYESNKPRRGGQFKQIAGDGEVNPDALEELYRVLRPNKACYLFTRKDVQPVWEAELEKVGFRVVNEIIWDKGGFSMGDLEGDWATVHEKIIYCVKGDHKLNSPRPKTVLTVQKVAPSAMVHPNEKPVGVWYEMIRASSNPGDLVLDPYAGSCSSVLACRQMGRSAIGIEIDLENLKRVEPRLLQLWAL